MTAWSASQRRTADSTSVLSTALRSNVERDDLEHIGGGGLLLQRFAQLVEQPPILNGNHSLGGEIGDERNLFVGERPDLLTIDGNNANKFIIPEHRHVDRAPNAANLDRSDQQWMTCLIG